MQGGDTMAMINVIWPFILMGGIFYFYAVSFSETRTTKTSENA